MLWGRGGGASFGGVYRGLGEYHCFLGAEGGNADSGISYRKLACEIEERGRNGKDASFLMSRNERVVDVRTCRVFCR